jgi:hypothetical protein
MQAQRNEIGLAAMAILDAMDAVVEATPDMGEGGKWHMRSDFAWQVREDYQTAEDPDTIEEFEDGMTPDDIRAACIRSAAKATARWLEEDKS